MPAALQAIEIDQLTYRLDKLTSKEPGYPEAGQIFEQRVEIVMGEPGLFYMDCTAALRGYPKWTLRDITWICYSVRHKPTKTDSPHYEHHFLANPVFRPSGKIVLGPMNLRPAEQVWPELTRLGWYGELPQFFT